MIATVPSSADLFTICPSDDDTTSWQAAFQRILPTVRSQAHYAFRQLSADAREEAVQEAICHACLAFVQLFRQGHAENVTPGSLTQFAILRCRGGREFGQRRNSQDTAAT